MKIELKTEPNKSTLEKMDIGTWAVDFREFVWHKIDIDTFVRMGPCHPGFESTITLCHRGDSYKEYYERTEVSPLPHGSKITIIVEK